MTSEPPDLEALGELVHDCGICIGGPSNCRRGPDGTMWCSRVRHEMPGFRVVGTHGTLTGFRTRNPNEPIDPETAARVEVFLKQHATRTAAERELGEQAAALTKVGLAGIPPAELTALLADPVAATPFATEVRQHIQALADAIVEVRHAAARE